MEAFASVTADVGIDARRLRSFIGRETAYNLSYAWPAESVAPAVKLPFWESRELCALVERIRSSVPALEAFQCRELSETWTRLMEADAGLAQVIIQQHHKLGDVCAGIWGVGHPRFRRRLTIADLLRAVRSQLDSTFCLAAEQLKSCFLEFAAELDLLDVSPTALRNLNPELFYLLRAAVRCKLAQRCYRNWDQLREETRAYLLSCVPEEAVRAETDALIAELSAEGLTPARR